MHVMIDVETLGVRPDARLLQIGAVLFSPSKIEEFEALACRGFCAYVNVDTTAGSIDHATIAWWLTQGSTAKRLGEKLKSEGLPLKEVLTEFTRWPTTFGYTWKDIEGVWAKPASFDLSVVTSAYAGIGRLTPWEYYKVRCMTTVLAVSNKAMEGIDWETGGIRHDALDDAAAQACFLQKLFAKTKQIIMQSK